MTAVEVLSMTQPPYALTQAPLRSLALGDSRGRGGGAWPVPVAVAPDPERRSAYTRPWSFPWSLSERISHHLRTSQGAHTPYVTSEQARVVVRVQDRPSSSSLAAVTMSRASCDLDLRFST